MRVTPPSYDAAALHDLHFFKNCSSVVSIVSLPKDYKLSYMDLNRLKTHLNSLFPNTTLKRYALVIGASANLSLTTLIAKSPCLSDDFLTLIVADKTLSTLRVHQVDGLPKDADHMSLDVQQKTLEAFDVRNQQIRTAQAVYEKLIDSSEERQGRCGPHIDLCQYQESQHRRGQRNAGQ